MILIALGSNLPSPKYGTPQQILQAVIAAMPNYGIRVIKQSSWHSTEPVPISDQPWFTNGVIAVETGLAPLELLKTLQQIESDFGRIRSGVPNEARIVDLDLLDYNGLIINDPPVLQLPHPRMMERDFVMQPLMEIVPNWGLAKVKTA